MTMVRLHDIPLSYCYFFYLWSEIMMFLLCWPFLNFQSGGQVCRAGCFDLLLDEEALCPVTVDRALLLVHIWLKVVLWSRMTAHVKIIISASWHSPAGSSPCPSEQNERLTFCKTSERKECWPVIRCLSHLNEQNLRDAADRGSEPFLLGSTSRPPDAEHLQKKYDFINAGRGYEYSGDNNTQFIFNVFIKVQIILSSQTWQKRSVSVMRLILENPEARNVSFDFLRHTISRQPILKWAVSQAWVRMKPCVLSPSEPNIKVKLLIERKTSFGCFCRTLKRRPPRSQNESFHDAFL